MYNYDRTLEYRLVPKISNDHIHSNNFQNMKVKLAAQVFSHSVAAALHTYIIHFKTLPDWEKVTANFIKKINLLFDIFNSNNLNTFSAYMRALKNKLDFQKKLFKILRVINEKGKNVTIKLKFIFGWRVNIKGIFIL